MILIIRVVIWCAELALMFYAGHEFCIMAIKKRASNFANDLTRCYSCKQVSSEYVKGALDACDTLMGYKNRKEAEE